jgi:putative Holliday junction resolvase
MAVNSTRNFYTLGLDVGDVRIGTAIAGSIARIPQPNETVDRTDNPIASLRRIINAEDIEKIVIGIPRNLKGEETPQSAKIRQFATEIEKTLGLPIVFVDESLSSKRADKFLSDQKRQAATQDSIAACFILDEYFATLEDV